jgi:hypothetical protein
VRPPISEVPEPERREVADLLAALEIPAPAGVGA